jgi:hypothetical protein
LSENDSDGSEDSTRREKRKKEKRTITSLLAIASDFRTIFTKNKAMNRNKKADDLLPDRTCGRKVPVSSEDHDRLQDIASVLAIRPGVEAPAILHKKPLASVHLRSVYCIISLLICVDLCCTCTLLLSAN